MSLYETSLCCDREGTHTNLESLKVVLILASVHHKQEDGRGIT